MKSDHSRQDTFRFPAAALHIQILDIRGKVLWEKRKHSPDELIQWSGDDAQGQPLCVGDYLCKLIYPDGRSAYVPFVLAK
jgi:hypothetical protein